MSQHFKTWVDMVITDPRMAAGAELVLVGKPAVLVTVRGGNYRPGTPREGIFPDNSELKVLVRAGLALTS